METNKKEWGHADSGMAKKRKKKKAMRGRAGDRTCRTSRQRLPVQDPKLATRPGRRECPAAARPRTTRTAETKTPPLTATRPGSRPHWKPPEGPGSCRAQLPGSRRSLPRKRPPGCLPRNGSLSKTRGLRSPSRTQAPTWSAYLRNGALSKTRGQSCPLPSPRSAYFRNGALLKTAVEVPLPLSHASAHRECVFEQRGSLKRSRTEVPTRPLPRERPPDACKGNDALPKKHGQRFPILSPTLGHSNISKTCTHVALHPIRQRTPFQDTGTKLPASARGAHWVAKVSNDTHPSSPPPVPQRGSL